MKKVFLTLALAALAAFSAKAQLRVEAGINYGNYYFNGITADSEPCFLIRALYDMVSDNEWGGDLGVQISETKCGNGHTTMRALNLDFPFHAAYDFKINDKFSITPLLGCYLGVGLAASIEDGFSYGFATGKYDCYAKNEGQLKRFRMGTDDEILISFCKKYTFGIGFHHSLINNSKNSIEANDDAVYFALGLRF